MVRNPGGPASGLVQYGQVRTGNPRDTPVMNGGRESDRFIVPMKPSNKGCPVGPAEEVEGRERAKGNLVEYPRGRTQGRETLSQAHDWVRQALCACACDPRQEPGAGKPHAGICAGGVG
jgi:hypothetical protein